MSDPSEQRPTVSPAPPPPVLWCSWPVRDGGVRGPIVVIGLLVAGVVVGGLSGKAYLGLLALAALVVALWRFFLPVVFQLSREGVEQRLFGRPRRISWRAIRRYEVCSAGVLLLSDEDRSAMAPFRGLYLPWTTHRDEVLAHVRHYLDRPGKTQGFVAEHDGV